MGMFMKASLKIIIKMDKEFINMQMEIFMKASLKMIEQKEKEFINMQVGMFMKAIFLFWIILNSQPFWQRFQL